MKRSPAKESASTAAKTEIQAQKGDKLNAIWTLSVQFEFKDTPDGKFVGGKLVCNHAKRSATALIPIPITDYPDVVRNLLSMERLPESGVRELLQFFTALNTDRA